MSDVALQEKNTVSVKKQYDLTGKNVAITGGAGFLSQYIAEAVSEMGASVILLDLCEEALENRKQELLKKKIRADTYPLDITSAEGVVDTINNISKNHLVVDVLINAAGFAMKNMQAGGSGFFDKFEEYDKNLWEMSINVNLTGTFLVTQAVGRLMRKRKKGVIINIASDVGVISPDHRIYQANEKYDYQGVDFNTPLSYSVSKAGILAMTRYLATYWADAGIRVNSLSPAGVYRGHAPKFVEQLSLRIPLGRMAKPEELKGPIVFLASDASSFMTGGNLIIDGGRTIW